MTRNSYPTFSDREERALAAFMGFDSKGLIIDVLDSCGSSRHAEGPVHFRADAHEDGVHIELGDKILERSRAARERLGLKSSNSVLEDRTLTRMQPEG